MARRGENIFKRKDGRWEARFIRYRDAEGRAVYGFVYGKSYTEAKQRRQNALASPEIWKKSGREALTVADVCHRWLADIARGVKESTLARYRRALESYILPKLGEYKASELDTGRVFAFSDELLCRGGLRGGALSAKTVTDILSVLKCALKHGAALGERILPAAAIKMPKRERRSAAILDESARRGLEQRLMRSKDSISFGIILALFTGLRIGELCALRFSDVDLNEQTLTVSRTISRIPDLSQAAPARTKLLISEPKTESSTRVIPLPSFLCECFRSYLNSARDGGKTPTPDSYVLTCGSEVCEPHKLYVAYKRLMARHGLGHLTFHALRHTFATRCVEAGFDTKSLSEILGHANVSTTLAIYVHPTLAQKRAQMERLAAQL